jgi:hypothetical protein
VEIDLDRARKLVRSELSRERAMLFMGAGFSSGALDTSGRTVPLGDELAEELFSMCFPGEERDQSALQDLFHHALRHHRDELDELLRARLAVASEKLPEWYRAWFDQPWKRAYTLNVDVIEHAAARRFSLERPVVSVSALRDRDPQVPERALAVIHLNGIIDDGCSGVTFATLQYGRRLASRDRWYAQLAHDLVDASFVFVGTRLDEAPLWQHLEGREVQKRREENDDAPRSVLVTTKLDRARRSLLDDFDIDWVCASAEEFAMKVLDAR